MRTIKILVACLVLTACGQADKKGNQAASPVENPSPQPVVEKVDSALAGSWVLGGLPQSTTPFSKLYPRQRPIILIQPDIRLISGSTGCNRFSASISAVGNNLKLTDFTRSTLTCIGEAEPSFLKALENSSRYFLKNNDELVWGTDSVTWMVFQRR